MTYVLRASLALATLCTAALPAQSDARAFLPPKAIFKFEMDGPAKLSQRFDGTKWGAMFKSQEAAALWERAMVVLRQEMESNSGLKPETKAMIERQGEIMAGYGGRVSFGLSFDLDPGAPDGLGLVMTCAMAADGTDALQQMLEASSEFFGDLKMPVEQATLANGAEVDVMTSPNGPKGRALLPQMIDDHLVFGFGTVDGWIGTIAAEDAAVGEAVDEAGQEPIRFEFTRRLFESIPAWIAAGDEPEIAPAVAVLEPLLEMIEGMKGFVGSLRPSGEFIEGNYKAAWDATRANLGQLLAPDKRVPFVALAPRTSSSTSTMSMSFGRFFEMIDDIAAGAGQSLDDLEDEAADELGIRFRADLFDHLDGTVMFTQRLDSEDPDPDLVSVGLVLGVKDSEALNKSVETVLRERGLHVSRKSEDYRERKVSKLNLFGVLNFEWTIGDGVWVLGFGEDPGGMLRSIVDAVDDRINGKEPAPWGERIQQRMAKIDDDWQWITVTDNSGDADTMVWSLREQLEMVDQSMSDEILAILVDAMRLMIDSDVLAAVSTVRFEPGKMVLQTIN